MTSNIAGQCAVFRRFTNYFHGHFPWSFFSLLEVAEISHHSQPTPRLCYNAMDISEAKEIFPTWDFMVDFPNKNGIWITTKIFQRLVTYKHQNTGIHGAQGRWRERWSMWVRLQAKPDCSRCPMETRALVRFVIRTFPAFVALNQWSSIHSFPLSWYFYVFLRSKPCFFFLMIFHDFFHGVNQGLKFHGWNPWLVPGPSPGSSKALTPGTFSSKMMQQMVISQLESRSGLAATIRAVHQQKSRKPLTHYNWHLKSIEKYRLNEDFTIEIKDMRTSPKWWCTVKSAAIDGWFFFVK